MTILTKEQTDSIKKSYLNIVGLFLGRDSIESKYLRCLLKWGFELDLSPEDLRQAQVDISRLAFSDPGDKVDRVESIYHLVHMICLDQVVEDVELEVASIYAEKLGFKASIVSDLLKSIVTADTDGTPQGDVRQQVIDFLELSEG
jgi:hypothetical protein